MARNFGSSFLVLAGVFVLCACAVVFGEEGGYQRLVREEVLRHELGGLKVVWETKVPMKMTEKLDRLIILGDRIYGLSDENYMVALHREDGQAIYALSGSLSAVGLPIKGLGLFENELYSIVGSDLVLINPDTGLRRVGKRLRIGATSPAVRNSSFFYFGGTDRRMHILQVSDMVEVFEVAADNDSVVTSIIADEEFVVFGTDAGNVISIMPGEPKLIWKFKAASGIVGQIVRSDGELFFASKDTKVYKLDIDTGELLWQRPYAGGGMLEGGPQVMRDVVYQYVRDKYLVAIDRKKGTGNWELDGGVGLLGESEGRAYVITNDGKIEVIDNKKAVQLYTLDLSGVSLHVCNTVDSKIYVADDSGRIACLEPLK